MNKKFSAFKYLRYTKSFTWSRSLSKKGIPISDFSVDKKNNRVYIRSAKHYFSFGSFPVFFNGYSKYYWKITDFGGQFIFENDKMFVKINELSFRIETLEELFIINEVFLERMYKIESNSDYIVFDIGMNVGITSLYLSQFDNIKSIYSFEPLNPTYVCALSNISRNPKYANKIKVNNYGLSNVDKEIELDYDPNNRGNIGVKNTFVNNIKAKQIEKIQLRCASEVLKDFIQKNTEIKFIVKMDCEGSEYDIIEDLVKANMLSKFDIFMIEWHNMEAYKPRLLRLIDSFKEYSFRVLTVGNLEAEAGMIYCFK